MTQFKDRAIKKSLLTRTVNKVKRQMNDGEIDNVKTTLTELTKLIGTLISLMMRTLPLSTTVQKLHLLTFYYHIYDEVCDKYNLVRKD